MESNLFARVRITPARSDISEQEFSRAKADFTVGPFPVEVGANVQEGESYKTYRFTFTQFITEQIRQLVDDYKKKHPIHLKYTYYITGVDFCTRENELTDKVIYSIGMRTHLIGILNSSVMYQINHNKETATA